MQAYIDAVDLQGSGLGLVTAVLDAQRSNDRLVDPASLIELGRSLFDACKVANCTVVVATSTAGVALVTAALMVSNGLLTTDALAHPGQRIMLVDGAIVTGEGIRETARKYRAGGATWLGALVVRRTRPDLDDLHNKGLLDSVNELDAQLSLS